MKPPQLSRVQLGVGIVLAVVVLGGILYAYRNRAAQTAKKQQPTFVVLDTRVVWTDTAFRIVNLENRSWLHCEFVLNKKYYFIREKVLSREVLQIAHTLFEDNRGMPYTYASEQPTSFTIRCENVGGRLGLFSGSYSLN